MKVKKIKITEQATETLRNELGAKEQAYNGATLEFRNSKGETKSCPANLIDRLGNYAGSPEDKASKQAYLDVYFKATHEARKGAENGADCRLQAGSSKNGVRITSTVRGIDAGKASVSHQYAIAQKMAREIHAIRTELEARANMERIAAEAAAKAKADTEIAESLCGKPNVVPVAVAA